MKRLNICIDIDGTMTEPYYFMPYFNKYFNKYLTKEDCTTHRIDELYGLRRDEMDIFYELNFCSSTTFPSASVARQWVMLRAEDEMQMPHLVSFLPSAS